jgi:hypothetical protein
VVEHVLSAIADHPVLIVRSTQVSSRFVPLTVGGRIKIVEEVIP